MRLQMRLHHHQQQQQQQQVLQRNCSFVCGISNKFTTCVALERQTPPINQTRLAAQWAEASKNRVNRVKKQEKALERKGGDSKKHSVRTVWEGTVE